MIFGGFLEHFDDQVYGGIYDPGLTLSDTNGFRLEALRELRIPIVRWPGGCFVGGYRWEPGVGKNCTPIDDMAWGVIELNTFDTDEYVELCRVMGWEPFTCNNAGNGPIEEMRKWVEYCNSTIHRKLSITLTTLIASLPSTRDLRSRKARAKCRPIH